MDTTPVDAIVIDDEPLDGIADRVAALSDLNEETVAVQLAADLNRLEIPVPTDRGLVQTLGGIVARLRSRKKVDDLDEAESSFEILALHVPPGGRAALVLDRTGLAEQQVSVKLLGFGYGSGRKLTLSLKEDIAERSTCMRMLQHVVVHVQLYSVEDQPTTPLVTTNVLRFGQRQLVAWPDCPYCRVHSGDVDPFTFEPDVSHSLDLRAYDSEVKRDETYVLEGQRNTDIGIALSTPVVGAINAGFHMRQQISVRCSVSYKFTAGQYFIPYRHLGDRSSLPYWSVG